MGVHEGYAIHIVAASGDYVGLARAGAPYIGVPRGAAAMGLAEEAAAADGSLRLLRSSPGGCLQVNYLSNASAGFVAAPPAPPHCNWSASAQPWYPSDSVQSGGDAIAACNLSSAGVSFDGMCRSAAYAVTGGSAVSLHAPLLLVNGSADGYIALEIAISPVEAVTAGAPEPAASLADAHTHAHAHTHTRTHAHTHSHARARTHNHTQILLSLHACMIPFCGIVRPHPVGLTHT